MTRQKRPQASRADVLLADLLTAFRVAPLLPEKRVARVRTGKADPDRALAEALDALLPRELLPPLLMADGLNVGGDWVGVFSSTKSRIDMYRKLLDEQELGETQVGVALVWRLVFFELAVRIAAGAFAHAPDQEPRLRHDLWARTNGFGLFLKQVLAERGHRLTQLEGAWSQERGRDNARKSLLDRWLYEGRMPQAKSIESLAVAIVRAGRKGKLDDKAQLEVSSLRLQFHLFVGCARAYSAVASALGRQRADTLAIVFTKQVHTAWSLFSQTAKSPPEGPSGPIPPDVWMDERRRHGRKALVFGISPGGLGSEFLSATRDGDMTLLTWPLMSPFLAQPPEKVAAIWQLYAPDYAQAQEALRQATLRLSIDDIVSDASVRTPGTQPLGWLGLFGLSPDRGFPLGL